MFTQPQALGMSSLWGKCGVPLHRRSLGPLALQPRSRNAPWVSVILPYALILWAFQAAENLAMFIWLVT